MLGTQGYVTLSYLLLNNKVMLGTQGYVTIATQFLGGYLSFSFLIETCKIEQFSRSVVGIFRLE